jgi:arylsulfatase A-like enzyme
MIDCMDQGIGRIIAQLKKDGRFDNTLIFFLQDNGGCAEQMGRNANPPESPKPLKPFGPDDLQPQIWPPMQTRDGRWVRTGPDSMPWPRKHICCVRSRLGKRLQHAVPRIQALGSRRRHQHTAHCALAGGSARKSPRQTGAPARPPHRHHGDLRGRFGRNVSRLSSPARESSYARRFASACLERQVT